MAGDLWEWARVDGFSMVFANETRICRRVQLFVLSNFVANETRCAGGLLQGLGTGCVEAPNRKQIQL